MNLGFIGFGGAGYGLAKGLRQAGVAAVFYYDRMQTTPPYAAAIGSHAAEIGAVAEKTAGDLAGRTDVLFSCVTGSMAVSVAREIAPFLSSAHLYIDVNTASPEVMEAVAAVVEPTGALFVDAAMMGAIPTFLQRVPILASGIGAELFRERLTPYGMKIRVIGEKPGEASAIKLFRSIFTKGLLSLFLELLPIAHRYGVDETVLASLAESLDGVPLLETARQQMTKGVVNAGRMAHEMEEVVATLEAMGAPAAMSRASRETLLWCDGLGLRERFGGELPATLAEALAALDRAVAEKAGTAGPAKT